MLTIEFYWIGVCNPKWSVYVDLYTYTQETLELNQILNWKKIYLFSGDFPLHWIRITVTTKYSPIYQKKQNQSHSKTIAEVIQPTTNTIQWDQFDSAIGNVALSEGASGEAEEALLMKKSDMEGVSGMNGSPVLMKLVLFLPSDWLPFPDPRIIILPLVACSFAQ